MFRFVLSSLMVLGISSVAIAKSLGGLPSEIQDQALDFEYDILDAITDRYMCQVPLNSGDFELVSSEPQEPEYAEYPGELSSFVVKVSTNLDSHGCDEAYGALTCRYKFDLYDEKAYRLNRLESECD